MRGSSSWLFVLGALAACGGDDGESVPPGPIAATVTHYDYTFDITSRAAHATVTATVTTAGDCFALPFRGEGLNAATAKLGGVAARTATVDAGVLTVCGEGLAVDSELTLDVDLTVPMTTLSTSQVGYSITRDAQNNPFYYLVSWVGGCDRFGPCDSRPDQFATYTFHVTHPAELMVACSGTLTEPSLTETQCEFSHEGGPTYSTFGIAAYPRTAWIAADKGMWGSVHATVYDRPGTQMTAAIETAHHAGFVSWMESNFGPYPYGSELRILTAPTYWSGFEHPGNIVLDDTLARQVMPSYLHNAQHILDHEIAHQWAGNETTLADTYDFVWKEAMAEYLTFAYEDSVEPPAALRTAGAWKSFSTSAAFFPVPGEKPALFDYYGDVYGPGPMVLFRQIEVLSTRAQVLAGIAMVLGEPRAISVADVIAALEVSTGLDLDAYAAAWIRGTGAPVWPKLETTYTPGAGTSTLRVRVTAGETRTCKFHIGLAGANPGEIVRVAVDTFRNGIDQTLTLPTPAFAVTSTQIDPLRECLVYPATVTRTAPRQHPWLSERGRAAMATAAP